MPFKFEGKEMYPIFIFANFWSIYSEVVRLGKNAHSKQRKTSSTQTLHFTSSLSACPASSASTAGIINLLETERYFLRAD